MCEWLWEQPSLRAQTTEVAVRARLACFLFACFLSPRATEETENTCGTKAKLKRKGEFVVVEQHV